MLTEEGLAHRLAPRSFMFFERAVSTQDVAQEWLRQGAPSGAVVIADEQLAGRGRRGRVWYTPPGVALALSMLLRYAFHELNLYRVSISVGEDNPRAPAFFKRFGFTEEVRRRQALLRLGRRWDMIHLGLLQEEWQV